MSNKPLSNQPEENIDRDQIEIVSGNPGMQPVEQTEEKAMSEQEQSSEESSSGSGSGIGARVAGAALGSAPRLGGSTDTR